MKQTITGAAVGLMVAILLTATPAWGTLVRFSSNLVYMVAGTLFHRSQVADGATAVAHKFTSLNTLATSGAKIASFYVDDGTTEKAYVDKDGVVVAPYLFASDSMRITTATALGTCAAGGEGRIRWLTSTGGTNTGAMTKLCLCQSDGAASPAYAWQRINDPSLTLAGSKGSATTCP